MNSFGKQHKILKGLTHLVTLDIGENRITSVNNDSFKGLQQLYGLRIVDNRLLELTRGFCDPLKKLRVLNVAQNRINKISSTAFTSCPELRALRLDTNSLEELPPTLKNQLPSLLWLNVSENNLKWADYHLLPQSIEWLDLSYNALESLGGPLDRSERSQSSTPYHLRVLDVSYNKLTKIDYTTIPQQLEVLRVNNNELTTVLPDTFSRSGNLRRVELMGNKLENLPLSSLRFPPVPNGKPLPEFYLGGNPFLCDCTMEWISRVNQLAVLRTHPRIVDLDTIVCRPTFSRPNQVVPLVDARPKDFLCPYKSHCFALCHCCEFSACDCEMTCPDNCTCYHDTAWSSNIVECSNLEYENIPSRIPMDATEIYLDGNNMTQLGSHIFIGKKNLKVLFLNESKVEFIRNKTFNGLSKLEILRLEDNVLTELHGYEFADLVNLRELYLQHNLLRSISKDTFLALKFLQVLRLDGNLLIDFNVWELSGNGYMNSVMLAGNPWTCDCEFLIPFRTWVASKTSIVVDFTLANCQTVNSTHVLDSHSISTHVIPNPSDNNGKKQLQASSNNKLYPIQMQHPISAMCNHNSELNFNFNPIRAIESEIMNNHISAMAGGAEKVAIPHPSDREIQFNPVDSNGGDSLNTLWTLILTLTALIVLALVIVVVFRKQIYYWIYTRVFSNNANSSSSSSNGLAGVLSSLLSLLFCCGDKIGSKSRSYSENDSGFLFDAFFMYSKYDEDTLLQKLAPELESQGPPHFRLCFHTRDLYCPDNPWNTDMILSACDASKRIVLVLSRTFLQSELSNEHFRETIQSAINRHQKKLILILLPPFSEQNLSTIYPGFKNSSQVNGSILEWTDKHFWSKLKLILPTPSNINTNTIGRRGSSLLISGSEPPAPLIDLHSSTNSTASGTLSSYTINRLEHPYSSHHQYHRNILPYQIPMSNCNNTLAAPVPKHHIALTSPFYNHQQNQPLHHHSQQNFNHYNSSQHSGQHPPQYVGNNLQNFISIPGIPSNQGGNVVYPMSTLPHQQHHHPQHFSFHESFRRHLQQQQQNLQQQTPVIQFVQKQNHNQQPPPSNPNAYQPLETNYSSSAISSSAEELEHVYSTLDSPLQSPNSVNTTSTNVLNSSSSGCASVGSPNNNNINNESANSNLSVISSSNINSSMQNCRNNGRSKESQNQSFIRTNSNSNNCNSGSELPVQANNNQNNQGSSGNNGQMYFV